MDSDTQLFIDGQWRPGHGGQAPVLNPANEEPIGSHAVADKADLDDALAAALRGFEKWRKTSAFERSKLMRRAAELLRERNESVARAMTMEQGKPLAESRMEAAAGADVIDWLAEEGRRAYGRIVPGRAPNVSQMVVKEPVGPVAAFSPWNFPINQAVRKISAALAAGCSIIIKGPEDTPDQLRGAGRRFRRRRPAARRAQSRVRRPGEDKRLPHPASGDQENLVHGVDRCRQTACVARGSPHEAGDDGAWRPRAGDRVRRR